MPSLERLPYVSVCIPVRNGESCLAHCLSNLLVHSNYPSDRFEIVLADHGSTDETAATITEWASRFPNVRSVHVPFTARCRAAVRNAAIHASRGELLVLIDHDVLTPADFLLMHARAHQAFPKSLVAGSILGTRADPALAEELRVDWDHVSSAEASLLQHAAMADPRSASISSVDRSGLTEVTDQCGSFRWFWGGNLSVAKADVDAAGLFDERYEGWGLEDGDFALQLRSAGRRLVFARSAWAVHLPCASDGWSKLAEWRHNFERFFRKCPTREIESYGFYGPELIDAGIRKLEEQARILGRVDVNPLLDRIAGRLPPRTGRRLAHFVPDLRSAQALALTDALCPFGARTAGPSVVDDIHFWPITGMKLPFAARELDEVVVLADMLMWLDPFLLKLLLCEVARCAGKVTFCASWGARERSQGLPFRALQEIAASVRLEGVTWIDV